MIAAFALFFFTALAGRLWCGYACPQTVWTEVFIAIERWCEGDRGKQMKLDAAPWTREKILRKSAKHSLWLIFALWTGFTFVGFFTPIRTLAQEAATLSLGGWDGFGPCSIRSRPGAMPAFCVRTSLQIHVPVCAFSGRDVRSRYTDHCL